MAYYSLHAYDADVRIPEFIGLRQDSEMASDLRFAADVENVETPNGVLQPQAAPTILPGEFEHRVETVMSLHRRWYTGLGSKNWIICASNGYLYYRQESETKVDWIKLAMPQSFGTFECNVWSWVTYETNEEIPDTDDTITLDVLLISNAADGMFMLIPPERPTTWDEIADYTWDELAEMTWDDIYSEKWKIRQVDTSTGQGEEAPRFGVIARYKERIWGGAIPDMPDTLIYSRAYDPTDWTPAEDPEEGGGQINLPSWDGDSFTAITPFGDQLIAFKGHRVWRVLGVGPGEYTVQEQYGGGTLYPNTVSVDKERILLAEKDGLSVYDGMTVNPFNRGYIEQFWKTVNVAAMDQMCAAIFKQKYYVALPTGESEVNNTLLVFNMEEGSFLLYKDFHVESLMANDEKIYATSSSLPGRILNLNYNSWDTELARGSGSKWETPWMDFNYKSIAKGGYEIYFSPEAKKYPVTFRFSIQTEKKTKTKTVMIAPSIDKQKQKRVRFGGTSRRFKLIVEVLPVPQGATWRLTGGIHMIVETDPD